MLFLFLRLSLVMCGILSICTVALRATTEGTIQNSLLLHPLKGLSPGSIGNFDYKLLKERIRAMK